MMLTNDTRKIGYLTLLWLSAVTVSSALSEELHGTMGKAAIFPTAVRKSGSLINGGSTAIGDVTDGQFTPLPNEKFTGRVQWDNNTGFFSITGLKMEDSGVYKVLNNDDKDHDESVPFRLTVHSKYIPVLAPNVSVTQAKHPCALLCTLERGTQVTLSLNREGEEESLIHTPPVNAPLHLSVTVDQSGTYTCEAVNPISRERNSVTVGEECAVKAQPCPGSEVTAHGVAVGIAIGVITAIMSLAVFVGLKSYRNPNFIKELKKLLIGQSDAASPVNRGERIPLSSPVNGGERIPLSSPVNGGHDNHMNGDVESQAPNGGARLQSL